MNVKDLIATDVPGIDKAKFSEWKVFHLRAVRDLTIGMFVAVLLFPIRKLVFAGKVNPLMLLAFFMLTAFTCLVSSGTHECAISKK